ncbi:MAG: CoA transferase [Dehalococcoidia bacterium]|nr:CoA transferase [Dehalococcoidia bacterium]
MAGPLEGVRVLDLTWILSGPYCTMLLADLGAEVVKIEKPGVGDLARGNGPLLDGESSYFLSINRGKQGVTLDLSRPRGRELFLALCKHADVVIENMVPGAVKRLGVDYAAVRAVNPRIVYASISGFGQTGPYALRPALDVIVQGMGGIMSLTGEPGGPPIRPGASLGDISAGLFAAVGILAALHERERSGEGQHLDIGMLDCQLAIVENAFSRYFATGQVPGPLGTRHPGFTPFQAFQTRDSWIVVAIVGGERNQWPLFCAAIGQLGLIDDPRFQDGYSRTQHYADLEPILNSALRTRGSAEWLQTFMELDIPCGPVNNIAQVAQDRQVLAREMIVEVPHSKLGKSKLVGTPIKLSRTPAGPVRGAPTLGEHTAAVLSQWLGLRDLDLRKLAEQGVVQPPEATQPPPPNPAG